MEGAQGIPRDEIIILSGLQQVLHAIGKRRIIKQIKPKLAYRYACRVIERVNEEEGKSDGQNGASRNVMIKLPGLSHKRENQNDSTIKWLVLQKIYFLYCDTNTK